MNLVFPFMWGIYGVFWCLVFRRFNPEKLITEKTANLVIITLVITLVLGCFNFQWAPAEDQKLSLWVYFFVAITEMFFSALPVIALAYVMKLCISLKEENHLTV